MTIGELIFKVLFRADTMKLKDFGKAVMDLNMSSILAGGALGTVYEGAKALVDVANHMALGLNHFSNETGQSTQDLQRWSLVAEEAGVNAGTVVSGVKTLQKEIFNMRMTGEGANIWAMLKLDPRHTKSVFEVLHQLGIRLAGMSVEARQYFLGQLGLGDEWLNILPQIVAHYDELQKITTMTTEQQKSMIGYQKASADLSHDWALTMTDLGVSMTPVVQSLKEMIDSIDHNVLQTKLWKDYMDAIATDFRILAHPGKFLAKITGTEGMTHKEMWESHPWRPFDKHPGFGGATGSWGSPVTMPTPKVNVNLKAVVHSNDPHTSVKIYQDGHEKTVSDAVNERPAGSY